MDLILSWLVQKGTNLVQKWRLWVLHMQMNCFGVKEKWGSTIALRNLCLLSMKDRSLVIRGLIFEDLRIDPWLSEDRSLTSRVICFFLESFLEYLSQWINYVIKSWNLNDYACCIYGMIENFECLYKCSCFWWKDAYSWYD